MKISLLMLFSVLIFPLQSCAAALPAAGNAKPEQVIPKSYELKGEQWHAWQKIQQEWLKTEYQKILQEQKLQMNCSGCENIYMDVVLSIDGKGKLTRYRLLNSKKCTDKFSTELANRFMAWFFAIVFPPALYGLEFEARLGTGLSC